VTLKVVGTKGVLNVNLFDQSLQHYKNDRSKSYVDQGYGSDLDGAMMGAFVDACLDNAEIPVTLEDGLAAARVSLRAYESLGPKVA
jgi:predicted dehydrogenase